MLKSVLGQVRKDMGLFMVGSSCRWPCWGEQGHSRHLGCLGHQSNRSWLLTWVTDCRAPSQVWWGMCVTPVSGCGGNGSWGFPGQTVGQKCRATGSGRNPVSKIKEGDGEGERALVSSICTYTHALFFCKLTHCT